MEKNHGFTLIELLVSIAIFMLLLGLSIANYIGFNDRQKLTQGAEVVREAVAEAQNSARSGKLRGCDVLDAYRITIANESGTGKILVEPHCISGTKEDPREFFLPEGVAFDSMDVGATEIFARQITGMLDNNLDPTDGQTETFEITIESSFGDKALEIDWSGAMTISDQAVGAIKRQE